MKLELSYFLAAAAVMLLFMGAPETALAAATERIVYQLSTDSCTSSVVVPLKECYTTIKSAIDAALVAEGDYITIKPGTYTTEPLTLSTNVSISGTETARTIISGGGSGPVITVTGVTSATTVTIKNLTITNASVGIYIDNSTIEIANNIFTVGSSGTAIQTTSTSSSTTIFNNTFYNNKYAISAGANQGIANNIFYSNSTAITPSTLNTSYLTFNDFYGNGSIGLTFDTPTTNIFEYPSFVNPGGNDFHLTLDSPCINAGNNSTGSPNDMGAYGGTGSDTIPFQVSGVAALDTSSGSYSLSVSWSANEDYQLGGYYVYYGVASGDYSGTGATEGDSPVSVAAANTSTTLSNLSLPAAPALTTQPILTTSPLNQALSLTWSAVNDATGYRVHYGIVSATDNEIDVGYTTSYTLTGLTNGQSYKITVTPYWQATYYLAVTAYYVADDPNYESTYSTEFPVGIGPENDGLTSDEVSDYPESISAYPSLLNKGCFIATAAYGYYSAPQVQALREFRDRYLVTNAPGRAFVRWYYTHGPVAAQFINDHPVFKPVVRAALMPAVGGAMFMTRTSMFTKTIVFMFIGLLAIIRLRPLQKKDIHHENI